MDAGGKYLIPGLWDMDSHLVHEVGHSLLLANGVTGFRDAGSPVPLATLGTPCASASGSIEACRQVAERFRRNGTWWIPTCIGVVVCGGPGAQAIDARYTELMDRFVSSPVVNPYAADGMDHNALQGAMPTAAVPVLPTDLSMGLKQAAGIPFMAGTDVFGQWPPAFN